MRVFLACLLLWSSNAAFGVVETYEFSDPNYELRYHQLVDELRCPKCQNQTISDSDAPIAKDLRRRLYEELEAGASDQDIVEGMVLRYGEFVRYKPAKTGVTLWLWLAPWFFLALGLMAWAVMARKKTATERPLSARASEISALLEDSK